jgi:hypothetical protein
VKSGEGDQLQNKTFLAEVPNEVLQVGVYSSDRLVVALQQPSTKIRTREAVVGPVEARAEVVYHPPVLE